MKLAQQEHPAIPCCVVGAQIRARAQDDADRLEQFRVAPWLPLQPSRHGVRHRLGAAPSFAALINFAILR